MALVYILSTAPQYNKDSNSGSDELRRYRETSRSDRFGVHRITENPEEAEIILFIDSARPDLKDIKSHPCYKRFRNKCFVVHHGDRIYPFIPGIFTCPERSTHTRARSRTGSYLTVLENDEIYYSDKFTDCKYLFSFVGRIETAPVRKKIADLNGHRVFIRCIPELESGKGDKAIDLLPVDEYLHIIHQSQFVLCPRGYGSSSYRLFETMKSGRVPVIISDNWIPPDGPDWQNFSIFVPEKDVGRIPLLLEEFEDRSQEMGRSARNAWDNWFSREVVFHHTVERCLELLKGRKVPESLGVWFELFSYYKSSFFRKL